jgi:hypothetical protein
MSLRSAFRGLAAAVGGVGLMATAAAQVPEVPAPRPVVPASYPTTPPSIIPPADTVAVPKPAAPTPTVAKVTPSAAPVNATEAFPKMLADARSAYAKLHDYTCHLVRQERVGGKLHPEQTCELRVRTQPFCVALKVIAPRIDSGEETVYLSHVNTLKVKFRPAGVQGIKYGFQWQSKDDPRTMPDTRHPVTDTGLAAVLDRIEKAVTAEKRMNHPVQLSVAEYTFAGKACARYELIAERAHPHRYAHKCVLYVDKETKLPVRFEAYDQPKGDTAELLEVQSFVGLRSNTGLGDGAFER